MANDDRPHVTKDRTLDAAAGALVHTHDLDDFEIPDGDADPRGWDVRASDGTKLGKVEDLLVDTTDRRVRYIEIAIDKEIAKQARREYTLVPIGRARLDDERDDVIVDLDAASLTDVLLYERERVSRDYETSLRTYMSNRPRRDTGANLGASTATGAMPVGGAGANTTSDRDLDFYGTADYDDRTFFTRAGRSERGMSGAQDRATTTGLGDRIADAADNLKDRIDGNPASKPGPDATDRRI